VPRTLTPPEIEGFRSRLIHAAARLFVERGAAAVSMRNLAEALNVSVMTPYRYFRDKDEILAAARAWGFDQLSDALEAAFEGGGDECLDRARAVADAYVRFAFTQTAIYKLMFDLSQPNEQDYPDVALAAARLRVIMGAYITNLKEVGLLAGDPEIVAHAFWAAFHGLVVLKLADKLSPELEFAGLWRVMTQVVTRGFARPDAEAPGGAEASLFAA